MVATVTINPLNTTVASGSFNIDSSGYIQGTALNDPAIRNELAGGILATTETLPMWGGVAISEAIASSTYSATAAVSNLGNTITRATNYTSAATASAITGFSVFDQDHAAINSPQSPVPLVPSGGLVNFYRLGSGARIVVAADPNIAGDLSGGIIAAQVSWDYTNQQLVPYVSATIASGTYTSGTGAVSLTTSTAHGLQPGDTFVAAATGSGGDLAKANGLQTATAGTTGTTLNYTIATGLTITITGGTVANGAALPVKVLNFNSGNSMTVSYASSTGFATWNRTGSTAVILI